MAQRSNNKVFLALVVALAMAVLLTETVPKGIPKQFKFAATSNSDKKKHPVLQCRPMFAGTKGR